MTRYTKHLLYIGNKYGSRKLCIDILIIFYWLNESFVDVYTHVYVKMQKFFK